MILYIVLGVIYFIVSGIILNVGSGESDKWHKEHPEDIGANDPMLGYILLAMFWPVLVGGVTTLGIPLAAMYFAGTAGIWFCKKICQWTGVK